MLPFQKLYILKFVLMLITRDKGYLNMSVLLMNLSAVHGTKFRTDYLKVFTFSLHGAVQVGWFWGVPFFLSCLDERDA